MQSVDRAANKFLSFVLKSTTLPEATLYEVAHLLPEGQRSHFKRLSFTNRPPACPTPLTSRTSASGARSKTPLRLRLSSTTMAPDRADGTSTTVSDSLPAPLQKSTKAPSSSGMSAEGALKTRSVADKVANAAAGEWLGGGDVGGGTGDSGAGAGGRVALWARIH